MDCKPKATPEQRERAKRDNSPMPSSRQDTWTQQGTPLYDHLGRQVGVYNDPYQWYRDNDRR